MEPISSPQNLGSPQTQRVIDRDPDPWKTFMAQFTPDQRKMFLKNMEQNFSQMIARDLRKMKETLRKMREES